MANDERQRQGNSYRQNCVSCFTLGFRQVAGRHVLEITRLYEDHSAHLRSESLFKMLPIQRRATIDDASEYMTKASGAKANVPLLQSQISSTERYAKRQDIRNHNNKSPAYSAQLKLTELEKMVDEMKRVQGATVAHSMIVVCR